MYTGRGFSDWGIGDVDVIKVGDLFHLFHLVLPNHAYVAHAVSRDGLSWERVSNAIFVGDPGQWDDDMLWTMHVSPDPDRSGWYRMFYTGLKREERGRIQRIGLAVSRDLYRWRKVSDQVYPLQLPGPPYECRADEGRHWVSFRDPFFYQHKDARWLVAAARVNHGPLPRRGCVAWMRETARDNFVFEAPLHWPGHYDDIEVPNLVTLRGRTYLIGSIREDLKVHYWYAERPEGPYANFSDNVLMPAGNYAARVCRSESDILIWNFFFNEQKPKGVDHRLPPPKELMTLDNGELQLRSYRGFDQRVQRRVTLTELLPLRSLRRHPNADLSQGEDWCRFGTPSSFADFLLQGEYVDYRLRGSLSLEGSGKCGLLIHQDPEGNGYYLSLDLYKGLAQLRSWGVSERPLLENSFHYRQLQAAYFLTGATRRIAFELLVFDTYLEFSINHRILLSLGDDRYTRGAVGFYTESAFVRVEGLTLETLEPSPYTTSSPMQPGE